MSTILPSVTTTTQRNHYHSITTSGEKSRESNIVAAKISSVDIPLAACRRRWVVHSTNRIHALIHADRQTETTVDQTEERKWRNGGALENLSRRKFQRGIVFQEIYLCSDGRCSWSSRRVVFCKCEFMHSMSYRFSWFLQICLSFFNKNVRFVCLHMSINGIKS